MPLNAKPFKPRMEMSPRQNRRGRYTRMSTIAKSLARKCIVLFRLTTRDYGYVTVLISRKAASLRSAWWTGLCELNLCCILDFSFLGELGNVNTLIITRLAVFISSFRKIPDENSCFNFHALISKTYIPNNNILYIRVLFI